MNKTDYMSTELHLTEHSLCVCQSVCYITHGWALQKWFNHLRCHFRSRLIHVGSRRIEMLLQVSLQHR